MAYRILSKSMELSIVTSGYRDRFPLVKTSLYVIQLGDNPQRVKIAAEDDADFIDQLQALTGPIDAEAFGRIKTTLREVATASLPFREVRDGNVAYRRVTTTTNRLRAGIARCIPDHWRALSDAGRASNGAMAETLTRDEWRR